MKEMLKKIRNQINLKKDIERAKGYVIKFLNNEIDYEPLKKCNSIFWESLVVAVIALIILLITIIRKSQFTDLILSVLVICFFIAIITVYSGCDMIKKIEQDEIHYEVINVIGKGLFEKAGTIEAVTEKGENLIFIAESSQKIKKKRTYNIYWYERNGDRVITYAKQVSKEKKSKLRKKKL